MPDGAPSIPASLGALAGVLAEEGITRIALWSGAGPRVDLHAGQTDLPGLLASLLRPASSRTVVLHFDFHEQPVSITLAAASITWTPATPELDSALRSVRREWRID